MTEPVSNAYTLAPIRSGDRIPTGTGPDRRRLTLEEAEAGGLPDRFTPEEWAAMRRAAAQLTHPVLIEHLPPELPGASHARE